jgi:hypothetical protein
MPAQDGVGWSGKRISPITLSSTAVVGQPNIEEVRRRIVASMNCTNTGMTHESKSCSPPGGPSERLLHRSSAGDGCHSATATTVFHPKALDRLRKELEQARRGAGSDPAIVKRLAFLELGLRWTEIEVGAHTLLSEPAKADKEAVTKTLDERFALMRQAFRETPLALNVASISWGEDALWSRLGWARPATKR